MNPERVASDRISAIVVAVEKEEHSVGLLDASIRDEAVRLLSNAPRDADLSIVRWVGKHLFGFAHRLATMDDVQHTSAGLHLEPHIPGCT